MKEDEVPKDAPTTTVGEGDASFDEDGRNKNVTRSSLAAITKNEEFAPPRQRSDGDSTASSANSEHRGRRGRRRLAFGRVTTHPFDARQPTSLRFDDEATVSEEAASNRWDAFFGPAPGGGGRRTRGRADASPSPRKSSFSSAAGPTNPFQRDEGAGLVDDEPEGKRSPLTRAPPRGSVATLLDVLDEVSLLASATSRVMPQSPGPHDTGGAESLPTTFLPLDRPAAGNPPSRGMDLPSRRRYRGIEALLSDPLRAANDSSIHDDKAEPFPDPDERPRRTTLYDIRPFRGKVDHVMQREEPFGPGRRRTSVTRVAPPRQVGRRGSTLSAFLRAANPTPHGERRDERLSRGRENFDALPRTAENARGQVVSDRGSTQESASEEDVGERTAGDAPTNAPSRFRFAVPLPRRSVGAKSSEPGTASSGAAAEPRNRSSMVTNLPSRRFSLEAANPWYRCKDGLQATHGAPLLARKGSSRRWTLVSILPSRKARVVSKLS